MYDTPPQPVLTSHESNRRRGPQRFEVKPVRKEGRTQDRPQNSRPQNNTRRKVPAPPKGFDHDALLQAYKGVEIEMQMIDGGWMMVKLVDGDRFSLIVEGPKGVRTLVFKQAIGCIRLPTPNRGQ